MKNEADNKSSRTESMGAEVQVSEESNIGKTKKEDNQNTQVQDSKDLNPEEFEDMTESYVNDSLKEGILAYNPLKISRLFPKAYQKLSGVISERIGTPIEEKMLQGTLLYAPRNILFEFFDNEEVFVNIHGQDGRKQWCYSLGPNYDSPKYDNRSLAEYSGFMEAFKVLEEKLK